MIKQRINSARIRSGVGTPRLPALLLAAAALIIAALPQQVIVAQEMIPEEPSGQPTNLSTSVTSTSITLSWDAVDGATGYDVKQGASGTEIAVSSGTSHTFSGLTADTEYTLYARTRSDHGVSDWSSLSATTAPPAPSGLGASAIADSLTLRWSIVDGASGYEVRQGADGAVTAVAAVARRQIEVDLGTGVTMTATLSGVSHVFTELTANTAYTLYVRAKNSGGSSAWSSLSATTAPPAPSGLSATATATTLTLSWSAVSGATGYDVKLGAGSSVSVSGASHTFSNLTAGATYTLNVQARNSSGTSAWTSLSATTLPAAPSGLSATATSTTITLSWDAVSGATGYDVKQGASGAETTVSSGASHTFSGLTANTPYTLYARARNSGGASDWTSLSPTTAPLPPYVPPDPRGLARLSAAHRELNWTKSAGATGHEVKLGPDGAVTTAAGGDYYYGWHSFRTLIPNVEYTFYVRAVNNWGASDWVSRTLPGTAAPPPPSGLSASAAGADLKLSWTAARPSDTTVYQVKLNRDGAATAADSVGGHTFSGLSAGTTYTLYVRAKTGSRVSDWSSSSATTVPAAPSGLSAATTNTSLTLSWSAVTGATSYDVKQGEDGTVTAVSSGTSHTFSGLTASTAYTLYVRASNSGGVSAWTSTSATTVLAAPLGVTVVIIPLRLSSGQYDHDKTGSLVLDWPSVAGATAYEVKLGENGAAFTVPDTMYVFSSADYESDALEDIVDDAVRNGVYVRAKNSSGVSAWRSSLMPDPSYNPFPTSERPTLVRSVHDRPQLFPADSPRPLLLTTESGRGPAHMASPFQSRNLAAIVAARAAEPGLGPNRGILT